MKIYDREGTPNAARIRIVLAEKELSEPVNFVSVDLIEAEQKQDWFLAMNPIGKTPVLLLKDGLAISECTAITEYLDNLDGNPVFTGKSAREKALVHMMQRRVEIMIMEPIDDYFHYGTPGLGPKLRPWRIPDWPEAGNWGRRRGKQCLANLPYFDAILAQRPFLTGERFMLPDITLYTALGFVVATGLEIASSLCAIPAWLEQIAEIPCVKNRTGMNLRAEDIERMRTSSPDPLRTSMT